jgi:ComF family protein
LSLLDLIFPPACAGCGQRGSTWCGSCARALRREPVKSLAWIPLVAAAAYQGGWQRAIHTFKYRPRPQLAGTLAAPLADAVRRSGIRLNGLTFVPLHPARRRERGFNQSQRLAQALGAGLGLPVIDGLTRLRHTRPQVGLSQEERRRNLQGAFRWSTHAPPPANLGLVDDVATTGATLEAAAGALEAAGARPAAILVLAAAAGWEAQTLAAGGVTPAEQPACSNLLLGELPQW